MLWLSVYGIIFLLFKILLQIAVKLLNIITQYFLCSVQFSSVTQSCPTLCNPMNCSTPGLPVHQQLPEFTQTHAHRVSDAIQPSPPLSSPSPPAPNPSQHQGLFQWINSLHEVEKVLELQLQHQSFLVQWSLNLSWYTLKKKRKEKSFLDHNKGTMGDDWNYIYSCFPKEFCLKELSIFIW